MTTRFGKLLGTALTGAFATFSPAVDGLDAPIGSRWGASDCPVFMDKVGPAVTDWVLARGSALANCTTAAQVNALYQGLSRRPDLDFTPGHVLTPDQANNRFTDSAGDHLTRQGLGSGATITRSPLPGVSYQAEQTHGNASFYAAADATKYEPAAAAFVIGWVGSCTQNAGGAPVIGKESWPPGSRRGYGTTYNTYGGFGFEVSGVGGLVNTDTPYGAPDTADGKLRVFHLGRSVTGGFGFVRAAEIAAVTQSGPMGDATSADAVFGLMNDGGGLRTAAGNTQWQKILYWSGAAAENVIAQLGSIEGALQSQLDGFEQQRIRPASFGGSGDFLPNTTARVLGTAFQPSPLRPVLVSYSVDIGVGGLGEGYVELRSDGFDPPTTVRARVGRVLVAGAFPDGLQANLSYLVPPSDRVRLVAVTVAGTPTFSIVSQVECPL